MENPAWTLGKITPGKQSMVESLATDSAQPLRHVAVIMDGNNRWAKARGLPGHEGHRAGVERVRDMIESCQRHQVEVLTLFAFSSENWQRPALEVSALMTLFATYIKKDIEAEIKPELLFISYAFYQPVEIYINNSLVEKEAEMKQELARVGSKILPQYNLFTSKYLVDGNNSIIFKIPTDVTKQEASFFAAELSIQFDKEVFEHYQTTEQFTLYSDFTWMTRRVDSNTINDSTVTDEKEWIPANGSNFKFFKTQMYGMEESEAVGIWYPVIDSNNVETVIFRKDIDISGEIINATLKCIGQNTISIWINDQLIVEDKGIVVDDRLKKIQPFEYNVDQLLPGLNTIEIKVDGGKEYKGLIFEMTYRAKKKLTE